MEHELESTITHDDIQRLAREHSPQARADLAEKIAENYRNGALSPRERQLADEIFRLLMADAEILVRQALSESLKHSHDLPHDIAIKLARDVENVAVPMLSCSMALSEEDLIDVVRSTSTVLLLNAVAQRQSVSAELSNALLAKNEREVWQTLFANRGAVLEEASIERLLEEIKGEDSLLQTLVSRGDLSIRLAERLFSMVSDDVKRSLNQHYNLALSLAEENAEETFELMTLGLVDENTPPQNMEQLAALLYDQGKLSFSLIVRTLCVGKLRFFEHAIARMANVPLMNARILVLDPGPHGFKSLYDKSGMPQAFYPAVKALLEVALEETHQGRYERENYSQRMVERVMAKGYNRTIEHIDYLTAAVGKNLNNDSRPHVS